VSLPAAQSLDAQWASVSIDGIEQLGDVFHEGEVIQVRRAINSELSLQVVPACIHKFSHRFVFRVTNFTLDNRVLLTTISICDKLPIQLSTKLGWLKYDLACVVKIRKHL